MKHFALRGTLQISGRQAGHIHIGDVRNFVT